LASAREQFPNNDRGLSGRSALLAGFSTSEVVELYWQQVDRAFYPGQSDQNMQDPEFNLSSFPSRNSLISTKKAGLIPRSAFRLAPF
jgi:hypothetical protein